jgi:hypothetical protein
MFDLIKNVDIKDSFGDTVEGVVTTQTPWVKRATKGSLAVRSESVRGFMNWIDHTYGQTRNYAAKKSSEANYGNGWQGFPSFKECYETFRDEPWKVRNFTQYDVPLKFADNAGNWTEYDVTGDFIDVGAMLTGEPEYWGHNTMGNPSNLFAQIVMNLSASAYFDGEALRRRGERVTRLIDWLETQSIRTEVLALNASQCAHVEVVVKRHDEPLNIDVIAVAGHSDFYRRLIFRVMEMSQTWETGHGNACLVSNRLLEIPPIDQNGILIFSENAGYVESIDAKFDKLEKDLERALEDGESRFRSVT